MQSLRRLFRGKGKNKEHSRCRSSGSTAHKTQHLRIDTPGISVTSLVLLADETHVVGGCGDGSLRRWRASDGCEIGPAMKSDGAVNSLATSSDGKWMVSGGVDCKVSVWDMISLIQNENVDNSEPFKSLNAGAVVTSLDISPDSLLVAAGLQDGSVSVWNLESGERVVGPLRHPEAAVTSVKFSPANDQLASGCSGWGCDSIRIWDVHTGKRLASLSVDAMPTYSLAWSHDGSRLFAGGPSGCIRSIDVADRTIISRIDCWFTDFVTSLCVSNTDRFFVAASASYRSLSLWDIDTSEEINATPIRPTEASALAISQDGHYLAAASRESISVWKLTDVVPRTYFLHYLAPSLGVSKPFTYMSQEVYEAWRNGNLAEAEKALSEEISNQEFLPEKSTSPDRSQFRAYSLANRALVRARLGRWDDALEDAETVSNGAHVTLVTHIAKAYALFGKADDDKATEALSLSPDISDDNTKKFVEAVKLIILSQLGRDDKVESECPETSDAQDIGSLRSAFEARKLVLVAECLINEGRYPEAINTLEKAEDLANFSPALELLTIKLIFGWSFDGLRVRVRQLKCKALLATGRMHEAIDYFSAMQSELKGELTGEEGSEWFGVFKERCLEEIQRCAEEAMCKREYDGAIKWYIKALDLHPVSPELLLKRSQAHAGKNSWKDALKDANQAIGQNPSFFPAYAMKCCALQNLGQDNEVTAVLDALSEDLRPQYDRVKKAIDEPIQKILHSIPLRMIDTGTGFLYPASKIKSLFERTPAFWDLVMSTMEVMDATRVNCAVGEFFQYVMFSHRWKGQEPLYSDIGENNSIYNLDLGADRKPGAIKLQMFCRTAREAGYRWAWSDTCCIDQKDQREFEKSINSMFGWYHRSSLTIVYLQDVSAPRGLPQSAWLVRGWTLQELLAPTVIRFFAADWTPYLSDSLANHKKSHEIMEEIASAVGVSVPELLRFQPSPENVRWKLHMASRRETTVPVDSAYCLCGIFDVIMSVTPGEPLFHALGRLLQEVIARSRSRDVSCLAWVGEPSRWNSCLPSDVTVYQQSCHMPTSIEEEEIEKLMSELASSFSGEEEEQALLMLARLEGLQRAELDGGRRLHLPSLVFPITAFNSSSDANVYIAEAAALDATTIRAVVKLPKKSLFVCPWIHELLGLTSSTSDHLPSTRPESAMHENSDGSVRPRTSSRPDRLSVRDVNSVPPSPSTLFDERTKALRFTARLRQPMTALLLSPDGRGEYKRVATNQEIVIQLRKDVPLNSIQVDVVKVV